MHVVRRSASLVAVQLLCSLLAVGCSAPTHHPVPAPLTSRPPQRATQPVGPLRTFAAHGLRFRYPARWRAQHYDETSSFTTSIVYLSTQQLHNPCRTSRNGSGTTIACGEPLRRLGPGDVLVQWYGFSAPATKPVRANTRVAGRPARRESSSCVELRGDSGLEVAVDDGDHSLIIMSACWASSSAHDVPGEIEHMLRTVTFTRSG
ncbi:MAG: hypothetical protein ACJ735_09455 [Actinomycetes bacterium]